MFANFKIIAPATLRLTHPVNDLSPVARAHGVLSGTRIATETGWREIETVTAGDRLLTADNGVQPVLQIGYRCPWPGALPTLQAAWPVRLDAGACGNTCAVEFLPDQAVILERGLIGAPEQDRMTVPAVDLEKFLEVDRASPRAGVVLHTLFFAEDEVVYVDGGLLMPCPRNQSALYSATSGKASLAYAA